MPYDDSKPAYNTDWNNLAPSVGATWRPNIGNGILSKILSSDPVFRGGYSISFNQLGTNFFSSNYGTNPGRTRSASRSTTSGTPPLGADGGFPVLLRNTTKLYPSAVPVSPTYPLTPAINESIDIHYPDWPITNTHQYSFGIQRELGRSMALDIRYVGNTNVSGWTTWNMNEPSAVGNAGERVLRRVTERPKPTSARTSSREMAPRSLIRVLRVPHRFRSSRRTSPARR